MLFKKLRTITTVLFILSTVLYAQDDVLTLDPLLSVSDQIIADTTANGGILPTRVYELLRDEFYLQAASFIVPAGSTLRMRAAEGTGKKPVIYLDEVPGTGRPPGNWVVLNGGNLEVKNICVVGYFEDFWEAGLAGIQAGIIQTGAVGSTIILDNVILSNVNGQIIRTNATTAKVQVTNSIFANMGALTRSNLGAGKGIDLRDVAHDTVIFVNNTFVNYQDRVIRHLDLSVGGTNTGAIKYLLFDHNTLINGMGFHGTLSLGNVGDQVILTNNLFVDAFALGEDSTDITRAGEWLHTGEIYPNGNNRMTWVLTVPNDITQYTVHNNFSVISPEGLAWLNEDHFTHGPFGVGSPLSWYINSKLGADSVNAFTREDDLILNNKPMLMTNMMTWYEDPLGGNRSKNTPGSVFDVTTDDFDRRKVEYFRDTLDAAYPTSAMAYTGAQGIFPAGDLNWFPSKKAEWEIWITDDVLTLDPLLSVSDQIIADTTANGGILPTRVYELLRDEFYLQAASFIVPAGSTLRMRAAEGTGKKPVIYLDEVPGTGRPPGNWVVLNGGNLEVKNICVVGYFEDFWEAGLAGIQAGIIQTGAVGSTIILDNVILSNVNGQIIRTNATTAKVQVTNSIFANMGALTRSNLGAGKGIDLRDVAHDTVIFVNNTFVNYQDRVIRHLDLSVGGTNTGAIKYLLFDHNTLINGMGFHGTLSLGNVGDQVILTNNLFVDAFALGEDSTDITRAGEWLHTGEIYPNGNNRMTWVLTVPNDITQYTVHNNFSVISPEGLAWLNEDHFTHGPFGVGSPLSWYINSKLGADSVNAFTREDDLILNNKPMLMTNMMTWYEDPLGGNRSKNTPGSVFDVTTDDFDRRKVEYFRDTLDAAYPTSAMAYTGAQGIFPAGDLNWFPSKKAEWEIWVLTDVNDEYSNVPVSFKLNQNYPNPFNPSTKISFSLENAGKTTLTIYNILGQKVATILSQELSAGHHEINFDASNLSSGVYLYKLDSSHFTAVKKMMILK